MSSRTPAQRRVIPGSPFSHEPDPEPQVRFAVDDQVCHDRHGLGRVIETTGDHEVIVNFGSSVRRIAVPNPKLTKL